ncbi:hypothetical protein KI387_032403, partial [Taxus chinensis]
IHPTLYVHRNSIRTSIGATPYSQAYDTEAIMPLEVDLPSLRISLWDYLDKDKDYRVTRLVELELLDEKQIRALNHIKVYQNRVSRGYNKSIIHHEFDVVDL